MAISTLKTLLAMRICLVLTEIRATFEGFVTNIALQLGSIATKKEFKIY